MDTNYTYINLTDAERAELFPIILCKYNPDWPRRYPGDWDEVHFRDYLLAHPEAAEIYGKLKRELKEKHERDRDGYTNAKGEFVEAVTKRARGIVEKMYEFFVARLDIYEDNMLHNVEGLPEGYFELAKHIRPGTKTLLDLGCGTGLELDEIFRLYPNIEVTGIDLAYPMLVENLR